MTDSASGHVWLVGAGPGDPGLLTLAGAKALAGADVVLYDALAPDAVLRHARAGAEVIYAGKRAGAHGMSQAEIEAEVVRLAREGKRVVRLKGGDPFVFGRGGEEALACRRAGVPFTVVPGITSAIAAAAYAGVPVTHRHVSSSFMVIIGSRADDPDAEPTDWEAAAKVPTLVVLMGAGGLNDVVERLRSLGRAGDTPAACIRWGTRPDQQVVTGTLDTIVDVVARAGLESPIATVVGDVVNLRGQLDWFVPGPLAGRRIVVTRARPQASDLASRLEALGGHVVEAPVIAIEPRTDDLTRDERVSSRWDWIVFTSVNAVDVFLDILRKSGRDARSLGATKLAAIGQATAQALGARGLLPDFVPSRGTSEALAAELDRVSGARIFLPVSNLTDNRLADALRRRGALVEQVVAYETAPQPLDEHVLRDVLEADAVTFASGSAARNLRAALGESDPHAQARLVSIGPEASKAVRDCFGRVDREAAEPTIEALVTAVTEELAWA